MNAATNVHAPDAHAEARAGFYDAIAWVAYAGMFLLVPMVVVVFRLHMGAVHYYLAGASFMAFVVLFFAMDGAATDIRDRQPAR